MSTTVLATEIAIPTMAPALHPQPHAWTAVIPRSVATSTCPSAPGIATRSVAAIKGFTGLLEELGRVHADDEQGVGALLEAVIEKSGYLAELRASRDPQDETRIENLAELVAVAQEFDETRAETGGLPRGGRRRDP